MIMNTDEKLRELYTEVFDEVHASDELLRKVKDMTDSKQKRNVKTAVKVLYATAAAAAVLVAGNVAAYAATGDSLLHIFINGEEQQVISDGGVYSFSYGTDRDKVDVEIEGDFSDGDGVYIDERDGTGVPELVTENGAAYLVYNDVKIDITQDMEDGSAEGTFEYDGAELSYTVDSDGNISLSWNDAEEVSASNIDDFSFNVNTDGSYTCSFGEASSSAAQ